MLYEVHIVNCQISQLLLCIFIKQISTVVWFISDFYSLKDAFYWGHKSNIFSWLAVSICNSFQNGREFLQFYFLVSKILIELVSFFPKLFEYQTRKMFLFLSGRKAAELWQSHWSDRASIQFRFHVSFFALFTLFIANVLFESSFGSNLLSIDEETNYLFHLSNSIQMTNLE